jgi:hypothetical protein
VRHFSKEKTEKKEEGEGERGRGKGKCGLKFSAPFFFHVLYEYF